MYKRLKFTTCECDLFEVVATGQLYKYNVKCQTHAHLSDADAHQAAKTLFATNGPELEKQKKLRKLVRPAYIRLKLLSMGLLAPVETALQQPGNEHLKILWEYSTQLHRYDPFIVGFATWFGLTSNQVDQIFLDALAMQEANNS